MRPLYNKISGKSLLFVSYIFRNLFGLVFLICLGFSIGIITGLYKRIAGANKDDITIFFSFGVFIIVVFGLWLFFYMLYRRQRKKEERNVWLEYLEGLHSRSILSQEDFLKEKEDILNKY